MVKPAHRRQATQMLIEKYDLSERRACGLSGIWRSTYRYVPRDRGDEALRERLKELAHERRRFGYRQLWRLLRLEGHRVNHKRVYRIYREEGLGLRRRLRRRLRRPGRETPAIARRPGEVWAMDFVHDSLADGRLLRCLTILDVYTRRCLAIEVDLSVPSARVSRVLDRLRRSHGSPERIIVDNGPEFTSHHLQKWSADREVDLDFIEPGKPTQNAFIESFNRTLREECLNEHFFLTCAEARREIEDWRRDYNEQRPHSSLGGLPPMEFFAREAASLN